MFPDTKALTASVEANTAVLTWLLQELKVLNTNVSALAEDIKGLKSETKVKNTGTNSTGPK